MDSASATPEPRLVRLTAAGRKAFWEAQVRKPTLPTEYLRIMGLVEFQGHANVIRSYLRHYPDRLIDEWLAEIEELGLIETAPASAQAELAFAGGARALPPLLEEDKRWFAQQATAAGALLGRTGVYIAEARVQNRSLAQKPASETEILIVEDDPDQLALAELRVTMSGYRVRLCEGAKALLQALQARGAPDLVLLDVMLPDGDGFDILADLRRHPTLTLLPVIMLTVKGDPEDIQRGLALGADGYVTKPYSKAILAETIGRVLGRTPA